MKLKEFPPLKPSLTVKQQLELLQKRGLVINNQVNGELLMRDNNYYRLNWYFKCFMDTNDIYSPEISLEQIFNIYRNDHWFRKNLFPMLELFEIKIKSNIAYYLGQKYGPDCFYKHEIYHGGQIYVDCRRMFAREIWERTIKEDGAVIHHRQKYGGRFPIWVVVEYMTLNTAFKYYSLLCSDDRLNIAEQAYNVSDKYLQSWWQALGILRNICSHNGYLYKRNFKVRPNIRLWKKELGKIGLRPRDNNTLFALCIVLRRLTEKNVWDDFSCQLERKEKEDQSFVLADYGFPSQWQNILM